MARIAGVDIPREKELLSPSLTFMELAERSHLMFARRQTLMRILV